MSRIAFILLHPSTHSLASFMRVRELALNLEHLGYESIILTPYERSFRLSRNVYVLRLPDFPVKTSHLFPIQLISKIYGLTRKIYYSRKLQPVLLNVILRKYIKNRYVSNSLLKIVEKYGIDILQAEQDNAGLVTMGLRGIFRGPLVLDLHGIWSEELVAAGTISERSKEYFLLQLLMKEITNSFDMVIALSEEMRNYIVNHYKVNRDKVIIAPPGGYPRVRRIPRREGVPRVVYAGTLTYSKGVKLLINSLPIVYGKKPNITFYFTKKGELLNELVSLMRRKGVNIRFFWFEKIEKLYSFLMRCHIGLQPSNPSTSSRINVPSKVIDYLSVGVPIVANDVGGWTEDIKRYKAGVVTGNSPEEFAEGLIWLLDNPKMMEEYSHNSLRLLNEKYNWEKIAKILAKEYEKLLSKVN